MKLDDLLAELGEGVRIIAQDVAECGSDVGARSQPSPATADGVSGPGVREVPQPGHADPIEVPWSDLEGLGPTTAKHEPEGCPHGFPSKASCVDCMMDGPVLPPRPEIITNPGDVLKAGRFQVARHHTRCCRPSCFADIEPGEAIGHVEGIGWCCRRCTVR